MFEFILPDLGEGIHEGQIVNVLVKEGEPVSEYQPMLEVETDKAAVEIPSPRAGIVAKVLVQPGQTVKVGEVMLRIDEGAGKSAAPSAAPTAKASAPAAKSASAPPSPTSSSATATAAPPRPPAPPPSTPAPRAPEPSRAAPAPQPTPAARRGPVPAAPVVRRMARELGVDLHQVAGTGPGGRVLKQDVQNFAANGGARPASASTAGPSIAVGGEPLPDFAQWGPIRREQPAQIRKTIARQMTRAWHNVPRVTHCDSADITELEKNRKALNADAGADQPKVTTTAVVLKVVGSLLRRYPMLNCTYDAANEEVIYKDYVHLGIAVDTPRGLVVPVLRDVDRKTLLQLATELNSLAERARSAKFEVAELRGATFTITNVGALGGTFVTPMVNFPETGILGLGRAAWQPVVNEQMQIVPRMLLPLSLSFDHRICDGADAARFTREAVLTLQNPLRILSL